MLSYLVFKNDIGGVAFSHPILHKFARRLVRDNYDTLDPEHHPMPEVTLAIAASLVSRLFSVSI